MCLGSPPKASIVEAAAPPPPPPPTAPATPAFNEATTESRNAGAAVDGARRGRSALRIDMGMPTGGSGLTIQR